MKKKLIELYLRAYRSVFPLMPSEAYEPCRKEFEAELQKVGKIMNDKRFNFKDTIDDEVFLKKRICDDYTNKSYDGSLKDQGDLCELLNELNDENIQLQKENKKLKSGYDWEFELRIINGVIDEVDHIIDQRINDVLPKRYHQSNMYFAAKDELANLKKDIHREIGD